MKLILCLCFVLSFMLCNGQTTEKRLIKSKEEYLKIKELMFECILSSEKSSEALLKYAKEKREQDISELLKIKWEESDRQIIRLCRKMALMSVVNNRGKELEADLKEKFPDKLKDLILKK